MVNDIVTVSGIVKEILSGQGTNKLKYVIVLEDGKKIYFNAFPQNTRKGDFITIINCKLYQNKNSGIKNYMFIDTSKMLIGNKNKYSGFMSDTDIQNAIKNNEIVICPYNDKNLTPVGYNLTFTKFIFSVNTKLLCHIHKDETSNELYCYVEPNDTVLILTQEAVWVSDNIAGTFHSKVGIVSIGFGHISTTLDPNWEGPLLISLNNPTKKRLKLVIGEEKPECNKYKSFVTLIFYKMISKTSRQQDNLPSRIEILKKLSDSLEHKEKYKELIKVIDKIRNFESIQVKIGQSPLSERKNKIEEFKNKYKRFANEILNDNIETALDISKEISDTNKKNYWFSLTFFGIVFIVILIFSYYSYKDRDSNLLSLLAIITTVYIAIVTVIENLLRKKYL